MRTKLRAALSVFVLLSLANLGATGCGCKDAASAGMVQASADGVGNEADARAPKPKPDKGKKPCKKGKKEDTRGSKAKTKGIDKGVFKTRAEAVAARAKDMKARDPLYTRTREECSPKKCHLHLDIYTRDRRPGNKDGPLETWHYTYHRH